MTCSQVYDTDGNILQAIDDSLFPGLLAHAFSLLGGAHRITITELGCGTGRNTTKLLDYNAPYTKEKIKHEQGQKETVRIKDIFALDLSPGMLSLANKRWEEVVTSSSSAIHTPTIQFMEFNALDPNPAISESLAEKADLVISTLVLEHLPVDVFFKTVRSFIKPTGGYVVLTNMHADMGRRSRAGFLDEETGTKLQGTSFVYEIEEVVEEGRKWGFVVEGEVRERAVSESDVDEEGKGGLLGRRGRKWVGCKVWFGFVMRFEG